MSTPSAIEALECTEEFTHANFGVSSYKDGSGKSIEALDCSEDFRLLNFQESSYKNLQNKQQHKDVLKAIRNLECSEEFRTLEQVIETFGDDHVITLAIVDALGRPQEATFITEAAGIFVVSRGRSELSKSLNRWLFGEVVPSIKKHKPSEERTEDMNTTTIGSAASLAVTNYDFSGNQIRTIVDDNGEPWFVAKDVTDVLGFRMASDATRLLDDDEKGKQIVRTRGGDQEVTLVNEPGLYSLILKSRKPEAKAFKKWVTSEVLPSIRKHKPSEERNEDMNELSIQTRTDIILRAIDKDANGQRGEASQIRVSSLDVARNFGKQHKDVLKAIRNLECSEEFRERNFALVEIIEKNAIGGQVNKSYCLLTRDGFSFLAMGFTGGAAAAWKEAYIRAFNAMEKKLMEQATKPSPPASYLEALKALIVSEEARLEAEAQVELMAPKADQYDYFISCEDGVTPSAAMKVLGRSPNLALAFLRKAGVFFPRSDNNNTPKQGHIDSGYFYVKTGAANGCTYSRTMVTPRGMEFLKRVFTKYNNEFTRFCALSIERRATFKLLTGWTGWWTT